jgi:uncharacterized protein (DUF433 family)
LSRASRSKKLSDQELIERYIDPDFDGYPSGPADARLRESGVSVWILVTYLRLFDNDIDEVARQYDIPREAVQGALAFYRSHKPYIDARILLNEA